MKSLFAILALAALTTSAPRALDDPKTAFQPPLSAKGKYTVKVGRNKPDARTLRGLEPKEKSGGETLEVRLDNLKGAQP